MSDSEFDKVDFWNMDDEDSDSQDDDESPFIPEKKQEDSGSSTVPLASTEDLESFFGLNEPKYPSEPDEPVKLESAADLIIDPGYTPEPPSDSQQEVGTIGKLSFGESEEPDVPDPVKFDEESETQAEPTEVAELVITPPEETLIVPVDEGPPDEAVELAWLRNKKALTSEESQRLAELIYDRRSKELALFQDLCNTVSRNVRMLPKIDYEKCYDVASQRPPSLVNGDSFQGCILILTKSQNIYSRIADAYQAVAPVCSEYKKALDILQSAFHAISEKSSEKAREGESHLYLGKLTQEVGKLEALNKRLEIALKTVGSVRDSASRMITALEHQYTLAGAIRPSMDVDDGNGQDPEE